MLVHCSISIVSALLMTIDEKAHVGTSFACLRSKLIAAAAAAAAAAVVVVVVVVVVVAVVEVVVAVVMDCNMLEIEVSLFAHFTRK